MIPQTCINCTNDVVLGRGEHYQRQFQDSFERLRTTNEVPTDAEGEKITSIVDSISTEISRVDAALRQFQEEREVLQDAVQRFTQLKSCRRRLPPEVLCEIFRTACYDVYDPYAEEEEKNDGGDHMLDDYGDEKAGAILDSQSPYWTLTKVCRVWREVMLSDASIWAKLHFRSSWLDQVYIERDFATPVFTALLRARQSPLDISFDISPYAAASICEPEMLALRDKRQSAVFGRLCAAAEQWSRASLTLFTWEHKSVPTVPSFLQRYGIPSMVHNRLIHLEQLILVVFPDTSDISPSDTFGFGLCPSLRRVTLKNAFCADLPWQQITHLHIEAFRQNNGHERSYLDVIRSCRVLHALKLRTRYFEVFRGTPVTLPTLGSLETNFCDITNALVVPNLVELSVANCDWDDELRVNSGLVYLISRSKCSVSLTCLRLVGTTLSRPLDATFTAFANLEHFTMSVDLDIPKEDVDMHLLNMGVLLRRLTRPHIIWLKLRTLSIDVSGYPNDTQYSLCMLGDGLNKMLQYRSQCRPSGAVRLESFKLNIEADDLDDLDVVGDDGVFRMQGAAVNLKKLQKLRDGGMDIRICVKTRYAMEGQNYTRLSFGM